jgi:phage baseplate assembly protein W
MPTYIGFSTINANQPRSYNQPTGVYGGTGNLTVPTSYGNKFMLVDEQLVVRDFLNALNIPLGQKVGQPQYGTTIWSFVFEPNTNDTQFKLEEEIKRIIALDPRLQLGYIQTYPKDNGILLQVTVAVNPFNNPGTLNIFLNPGNNTAVLQ